MPGLNLLESLGDVLLVDSSAAVLNQDGPEAELQGVEGRGGDTDIGGDTTDINICAAVLSDQFLQAGLAQLSIVKKCRVRVNIGIDSLVDGVFLWVFLPQSSDINNRPANCYMTPPSDLCASPRPRCAGHSDGARAPETSREDPARPAQQSVLTSPPWTEKMTRHRNKSVSTEH